MPEDTEEKICWKGKDIPIYNIAPNEKLFLRHLELHSASPDINLEQNQSLRNHINAFIPDKNCLIIDEENEKYSFLDENLGNFLNFQKYTIFFPCLWFLTFKQTYVPCILSSDLNNVEKSIRYYGHNVRTNKLLDDVLNNIPWKPIGIELELDDLFPRVNVYSFNDRNNDDDKNQKEYSNTQKHDYCYVSNDKLREKVIIAKKNKLYHWPRFIPLFLMPFLYMQSKQNNGILYTNNAKIALDRLFDEKQGYSKLPIKQESRPLYFAITQFINNYKMINDQFQTSSNRIGNYNEKDAKIRDNKQNTKKNYILILEHKKIMEEFLQQNEKLLEEISILKLEHNEIMKKKEEEFLQKNEKLLEEIKKISNEKEYIFKKNNHLKSKIKKFKSEHSD